YPKSIFCWLVSDLCLSLVSSAMFEAVHFGAQSLTPLLPQDSLFTAGYMKLVSHPEGPSRAQLVDAVRAFVAPVDAVPRADVRSRIGGRLGRMIGPNGETAILARLRGEAPPDGVRPAEVSALEAAGK